MFSDPHAINRISRAGQFVAVQCVVIALNATTGFILVRLLPTREYAWLTILNAMVATYAVILEPMTGSGLQSVANGWETQPGRLSAVVATAFRARWKWLALVTAFIVPWTFYLLYSSGASLWAVGCLILAGIAGVPAFTGTSIWSISPRLRAETGKLQSVEILGSVSRLVLSVAFVLIHKAAALAAFATGLAQFTQLWLSRRLARPNYGRDLHPDERMHGRLDAMMRGTLAHTAFQCFQAQIGIWVLGLVGTQDSVAHLGALSRLGIVLAPLAALFQQVVIPRLARLTSLREKRRFAGWVFPFLVGCCGILVAACMLVPAPFLWVLGAGYQHLTAELPVAMTLFSIGSTSTILWWFNASCGATSLARWVPVVTLVVFGILAVLMRPSDTFGVLSFMAAGSGASLVLGLLQAAGALSTRPPAATGPLS